MEKVNEKGETLEEFLKQYDENRYRKPSNTVDMIFMTVHQERLKLLLIQRKNHPFLGDWALPGGFVDFEEDLEAAVLRELMEETHLESKAYFRQLYTLGSVHRDPRTRVISTVYFALTPYENVKPVYAGDDAKDALWFDIKKTTKTIDDKKRIAYLTLDHDERDLHMCFEVIDKVKDNYVSTTSKPVHGNVALAADHIKVINMAMDLIQQRAESTGILFHLLPKECTLREIQTVYEAVVSKKVDTANFRRDIRKMLVDTGKSKQVNGRQARLYRFNPLYVYMKENL